MKITKVNQPRRFIDEKFNLEITGEQLLVLRAMAYNSNNTGDLFANISANWNNNEDKKDTLNILSQKNGICHSILVDLRSMVNQARNQSN